MFRAARQNCDDMGDPSFMPGCLECAADNACPDPFCEWCRGPQGVLYGRGCWCRGTGVPGKVRGWGTGKVCVCGGEGGKRRAAARRTP